MTDDPQLIESGVGNSGPSGPLARATVAGMRNNMIMATAAYNLFTVPERVRDGDPWAGIDDEHFSIEPLLALFEEQGAVELNYPPDYPKMPGEPPRVQPSKKVASHWDDDGNRVDN